MIPNSQDEMPKSQIPYLRVPKNSEASDVCSLFMILAPFSQGSRGYIAIQGLEDFSNALHSLCITTLRNVFLHDIILKKYFRYLTSIPLSNKGWNGKGGFAGGSSRNVAIRVKQGS